ncbi:MAG: tripartite tricarboxylate transporter substrate binding protein [Pigmentiphaga sp.]|uniref:Bug family tripartite tricarboxylate transporter substrate binding protein n=1 Tax=Pigmentiphaga sp. TaxID=1977564 RepID=UPI0029A97AE2|nr:tripartite tricarboxylate transporter substrate binding protein [Pigmentiphaga sp.]MDX3906383.1 tripartite tricarboxylate transporter substrate binding protein [Pigmentiphaga sp.]
MKILTFFVGVALSFAAFTAAAQDTGHPIRIVVPFPAGATLDNTARRLAPLLSRQLGQPVIVENRVGAAGNVGAQHVMRSEPDGLTLLYTAPATLVVNKHLYPKIGFDHTSFAPVSLVATSPFVLFVPASFPVRTFQQYIDYAKKNPGRLSYGSMGVGTASHLLLAALNGEAGTDILHVPFLGAAPALNALLGSQVDSMTTGLTSTMEHIKAGKLIPLAITSRERNPVLPDVPSMNEFYPKLEPTGNWFAFLAPPNTPAAATERFARALQTVLKDETLKADLARIDVKPVGSTPAELAEFMDKQARVWGEVIVSNNITVQ